MSINVYKSHKNGLKNESYALTVLVVIFFFTSRSIRIFISLSLYIYIPTICVRTLCIFDDVYFVWILLMFHVERSGANAI